jgi:hypothetical protein
MVFELLTFSVSLDSFMVLLLRHNYKFFVLFLFWGVIYLGTFMVGVFPVVEGFISAAKPKSTRYR